MVLEEELKAVATVVLGVLLILEEVILVVVNTGVDVGSGLLLIKGLYW